MFKSIKLLSLLILSSVGLQSQAMLRSLRTASVVAQASSFAKAMEDRPAGNLLMASFPRIHSRFMPNCLGHKPLQFLPSFAFNNKPVFQSMQKTLPKISPQIFPQTSSLLAAQRTKKHHDQNNYRQHFNKWAKYRPYLFGTGAALAVLYAGSKSAKAESEPKAHVGSYKSPFEDQRKNFHRDLLLKPWGKVAQQHIAALEAEEKTLIGEMMQLTELTAAQLDQFKKQEHVSYLAVVRYHNKERVIKNVQHSIPSYVMQTIFDSLALLGVSSAQIQIIADNEIDSIKVQQSAFLIGDFFLENSLKKVPRWVDKKKCIGDAVRHEMIHILYDDSFFSHMLNQIVLKNPGKINAFESLKLKISQFHERRADTLAGLMDPKYALSAADFFAQAAQATPVNPARNFSQEDHEDPRMRSKFFRRLHAQMISC